MAQILSRMATFPDSASIILVSSGLPEIQQELWAGESQITDLAAQGQRDHSAIDARGFTSVR